MLPGQGTIKLLFKGNREHIGVMQKVAHKAVKHECVILEMCTYTVVVAGPHQSHTVLGLIFQRMLEMKKTETIIRLESIQHQLKPIRNQISHSQVRF